MLAGAVRLRLSSPLLEPRPTVCVFGVNITNETLRGALERIEALMGKPGAHALFIVNAHTLNLAASDPAYRAVLNGADLVLSDGIGVRLAAAARGVLLQANLNGTDLVPMVLHAPYAGGKRRVFFLGSTEATIASAARYAADTFGNWDVCGYHDGYVDADCTPSLIDTINALRPDLVLVGMGNPLQEKWIAAHRPAFKKGLYVGVGGLFEYWAGRLKRAPTWMRRSGLEWAGILAQQPHKFGRYVVGNPHFLARALWYRASDRRREVQPK